MLASNQTCTYLPCVPALVMLEDIIWFLSDLLDSWKKASSFVQTKPEASSPSSMLRHQASWLRQDSIPVIVQVIRQMSAPLQMLLNHCCTLQEFLSSGTSQTFSSHLFLSSWGPGHSRDWNFLLLCQSCHFLAWVGFESLFDGVLVYNLRSSWSTTFL